MKSARISIWVGMLLTIWCEPVAASKILSHAVDQIDLAAKILQSNSEKARTTRSIEIASCSGPKAEVVDRLAKVAAKHFDRYTQAKKANDAVTALDYLNRITFARDRAASIGMSGQRCWCQNLSESNKAVTITPFNIEFSGGAEKKARLATAVAVGDLCNFNAGIVGDGIMRMEDPQESGDDDDKDNPRDRNYNFPEIPTTSPFR